MAIPVNHQLFSNEQQIAPPPLASYISSDATRAGSEYSESRNDTVPLLLNGLVILAIAAFYAVLYFSPPFESKPTVGAVARGAGVLIFILSLVGFFSFVRAGSWLYPFVVFGFLQELSYGLFLVTWTALSGLNAYDIEQYYQYLVGVNLAVALACGAVLIIAAIAHGIQRQPIGTDAYDSSPTSLRRPRDERIHVKNYFTTKPVWPFLMIIGAVTLFIFSLQGASELYYRNWIYVLVGLFVLAIYKLVADDMRTVRPLDLSIFIVALYAFDAVQDVVATHLVAPSYENNDFWGTIWPNYLMYYFGGIAGVAVLYSLIYRFIVHPRSRRARDSDIDDLIASDMRPFITHGLQQLGVAPERLISEPVWLRGLPDKDALNGAFVGAHVGDDDVLRFTPQRGTVIAFTEDQVHFYEGTLDITTGRVIHESIVEVFYQDISNVARVSGAESIPLSRALSMTARLKSLFSRRKAGQNARILSLTSGTTVQFEGRDVFQINLESGRALTVVLRDDSFFDRSKSMFVGMFAGLRPASAAKSLIGAASHTKSNLPVEQNERVMSVVRSLIRDKKRSLQNSPV
jgi:hypothetical protein